MAHSFPKEKLKTVESQLSDASREQDEVKRLLEEFAAYTLANAKAEELVRAVLDDLEARRTLKERPEAATASSESLALSICFTPDAHGILSGILWEPLCLGHAKAKTPQMRAKLSRRRTGRTELHNAVCSGDKDYVQQLLKNHAFVDATDRSGRTPLHLAASELSEPVKIIELLLEARARTEAEDLSGFTPLNLACDSKCKEAVAVLQSANRASVDATDRSSRTALHLAANEVSGPSNIMRILLEARASLMAKDVTGLTPMTLACQSNEAVAVLQSVMADQEEKLKDEAREEWNKFVFEIKALWESNKLKQVLEIQEQRFGKEDRDTLSTKIDLAAVLQQQKDFTAAQQQLEEVFEGLGQAPSTNLKDDPIMHRAVDHFASLLGCLHNDKETKLKEVSKMHSQKLGED
ncbi:unnamed protein product, partial [Cladocopium goreaui]